MTQRARESVGERKDCAREIEREIKGEREREEERESVRERDVDVCHWHLVSLVHTCSSLACCRSFSLYFSLYFSLVLSMFSFTDTALLGLLSIRGLQSSLQYSPQPFHLNTLNPEP